VSNIILPANTLASGGLRVENALNFMGATNTSSRFQRTNSSSGSSTQATLSAWVKYQTNNTESVPIFMAPDSSGNNRLYINITSAQQFGGTFRYPDCDFSSTDSVKLRDPAAWYHIVAVINTNDATAADRLKIYVNNQRITLTFATGGGLGSGANIHFNTSGYKNIFGYNDVTNDGVTGLTDMYFSEVIKCDGQVLAPTDFAEYDDNGIWVPKTDLDTTLTFGTTGYYYNFADSADLGNDVSGNGNDASDVSNTTQSLDTPSNNFCTMNPRDNYYTGGTFTNGNTTVQMTNQPAHYTATFGVSTGKWYWEGKMSAGNNSAEYNIVGVAPNVTDQSGYAGALGATNHGVGLRGNGNVWYNEGTAETGWNSWNQGDIVMIALDLDNQKIFWGTNGTWGKSSDPVTGTNGFSISGKEGSKSSGFWFPAGCCREISQTNTFQWNFGNPQFTISSGNSDGNGYGNFEYAVPSGYYALNTKNLAEFG